MLTVSAGVLQSSLIRFSPELPLPTLRAVPVEEAEAMRARVVAAHARYLATPQRKWQGVLTLLLQRLDYRALA